MIRRTTTNKHIDEESRSSCCFFSHKKQLKGEKNQQLKPKSLAKYLTSSTPYRDLTIVEDDLERDIIFTPKPTNSTAFKLLPCKQETSTRLATQQKAQSFIFTPSSPSAVINDQEVAKPLQRLKNRRRSSHINDPLTIYCNYSPKIKFSYSGTTPSNFNKARIVIKKYVFNEQQPNIKKEIDRLRQELHELFIQTERLKLQKNTNMEHYKTVLFKLAKKEEEIKALQSLRREEVAELRKEIQSMISAREA